MTEFGELSVTYTGIEANQIFFEPVFTDEDILGSFRVMPNVVNRKKMQFVQSMEKLVRKYTGCGFNPIGTVGIYDREVEVTKMKIDIKQCMDEVQDTVFEELLRRGTPIHDLTGTLLEDIMINRMQQALKLDLSRIYYFGDLSNPNPNYDQMDGLWTVHIPYLVDNDLIPYYDTGSGVALAAGDGIDILRTVYDNAPLQLKGLPKSMKKFYVSGSVYEQYVEDIENGGGGDYGLIQTINGIDTVTFRGIPVVPQWRWDEIMAGDIGSPLSHLVLLTTPTNLVVATDIVNPGEDFEIWYDRRDEHWYAKSRWKMGGNYVHHSLFSVGY